MKKVTLILSMMIALIGLNANAAMYIVGNGPFGNWNPGAGVEMTDNGNGTYTLTTAISGTVYFVFGDGQNSDWNTFNANYRIGPLGSSDQEVTTDQGWVTTQKAPNGGKSYKFTGTGDDYVFTFDATDATNMKFKIEGYVAPITYDSFTVAGSSAALFGTTWDPTNADNDMNLVNGLYTFNKSNVELTAGNLEFKVVADHDADYGAAWPAENFVKAVEKHGKYDVEITFDEATKEIECNLDLLQEIVDPVVEDCYTIAGTENLFGSFWNPADSANLMTLTEGLYTWTKNNVVFEDVDTIEFKVVKNLDWNNGSWPENNWWYRVAEAGTYDFVITFNEETKEITFNATKQGGEEPPVVEFTSFTVAGPAAVFGTEWSATDEKNDMTLDAETGLYTWEMDTVALTGNFGFKVVGNHNWDYCWPASDENGDNNWIVNIAEAGNYSLFITFNAETKEINCVATKLGGEEPPVVEFTSFTVAGPEAVFGTEWNAEDENNDMVLDAETGLYTWEMDTVALTGNFGFKVVGNHNWDYCWPEGYDNNWIVNIAEAGDYSLFITFNAETKEINCVATKLGGEEPPVVEFTSFTVAGPEAVFGTEWNAADENNDMTLDAETGLYTWEMDTVALTGNFGFKVVGNHNWDYCWPASDENGDNNWIVNIAEEGNYSLFITFNAETKEINCVATKLGGEEPPVVEITSYTVAGPEAIFGTDWDATDENNDMTLAEGVYTWTKENVELTDNFGFKVVGNHDWAVYEWPMGYENNWVANVEEPGIYTIVITFDPEAADSVRIACELTKTGDIEPVHYDGDVYIMGEVNDNGGWFTNKGVKMTRDAENNLYTATITTVGENDGYSYFSFTKQLAETENDWDAIAPYRFGAVTDGDPFLVTEEMLGQELALVYAGDPRAFKIEAGEWNLTLSVDNMKLVIEKVEEGVRGDVDGDKDVTVADATALIDILLSGGVAPATADANLDTEIGIADVTAIIDYLLSGTW